MSQKTEPVKNQKLQLIPNAYNLIAEQIRVKYFGGITWHHDNYACGKAVFQVELFSNGCISLASLERKLARLCQTSLEEIKEFLKPYYTWVKD